MLQVSHLKKSYNIQTILDDVSFIVNAGERVGLIGANGCGKTTLLRIIASVEKPESGTVNVRASLGYLAQGIALDDARTIGAYMRDGIPGFDATRAQVEALAAQMAQLSSQDLLAQYAQAMEQFDALGGYVIEPRIEEILAGLGLDAPQDMRLDQLSGGQRTRVGLARLLLAEPQILLLDEPTNHLDIDALEWLERFLARYRGAALIVSHDWTFLDATVTRILELDDLTHRVTEYAGNYSDYVQAKARAREKQFDAWQDQQDEIGRLQTAARHLRGIAQFRKGGKADGGDKFAKGFFANRSLATVRRAKQIERRVEHLLTDEQIEKPARTYALKLEFGAMPRSGQVVLTLDDLGLAFGDKWLFRHANQTLRHGERIALVGANGSGKTTLLRVIANELAPSQGSVRLGANVRLGYMPQEQEILDANITPFELIRGMMTGDETAVRHLLHFFLFVGDEVFTRIGSLSYGERARLLLAQLVVSGANCLLLDEPINHLDIPSRERFVDALDAFPGTILVATHDRAFIDQFATGIWSPREGTVRAFLDRAEMMSITHRTNQHQ